MKIIYLCEWIRFYVHYTVEQKKIERTRKSCETFHFNSSSKQIVVERKLLKLETRSIFCRSLQSFWFKWSIKLIEISIPLKCSLNGNLIANYVRKRNDLLSIKRFFEYNFRKFHELSKTARLKKKNFTRRKNQILKLCLFQNKFFCCWSEHRWS